MQTDRHEIVVAGRCGNGWLFALPWLTGLMGLSLAATVCSLVLSLTSWNGTSFPAGADWVGLANYRALLIGVGDAPRDALFQKSIVNGLAYTAMAVPAGLIWSMGIALLLNRATHGAAIARTVVVLPYLLGGVATIVIWSWLLNPQFGLVNQILRWLYALLHPIASVFAAGGTSDWPVPRWFHSPRGCKPALAMMHLWMDGAGIMVLLAALRRVPASLHDAAAIDGAGRWHRFRHVTLPHASPAVLFNAVIGVIHSMHLFDQAYLLSNRAQRDGLLFPVLYLYRTAFEPPYRVGYACAMAWVLVVVVGALVAPVFLLARRFVFYPSR